MRALQDAIFELKASGLQGLKLQKTKGGPDAPFPVTLSALARPPDSTVPALKFDITGLSLRVLLSKDILFKETESLEIFIENSELPVKLRERIASEIHTNWAAAFTSARSSALHFLDIWAYATQNYSSLLSLCPEFLEAYEDVDSSGKSIRKWAILPDIDRSNGESNPILSKDLAVARRRYSCVGLEGTLRQLNISDNDLTFIVEPTDPAWDKNKKCILTYAGTSAQHRYPAAGSFVLQLKEGTLEMSELRVQLLHTIIHGLVESFSGGPGALPGVLRYMENHAGELLQQVDDLAIEIEAAQKAKNDLMNEENMDTPHEQYSSSSGDEDPGVDSIHESPGSWHNVCAGGGQLLKLQGLELLECDTLEPLHLQLEVVCGRCKAHVEVQVAQLTTMKKHERVDFECKNCHKKLSLSATPRLIHEASNILAIIESEDCTPSDLLPSLMAGQCSKCNSSISFRNVQLARWNERTCSHCGQVKVAFQYQEVQFVPRITKRHPSTKTCVSQIRAAQEPLVIVGHPLPLKGTCSHYKHSYRWLRFPCCGKRYPCDLCHEEGVEDGHPAKWAVRMTCGYCSTEQPVSETCNRCNKKLATKASNVSGRNTRFWEGGKGCRCLKMLDPRDPHKYRGRSKTKSRKSSRSGQKERAT